MHSWRHLFPTCAKQLQLADSLQTEIGHWAHGSSMPRRYDSATCATKLIGKAQIFRSVTSGWQVAAPGCVPNPPPVLSILGDHSTTSSTVNIPKASFVASKQSKVLRTNDRLLAASRQVLHIDRGRYHLYSGGIKTVCFLWKCGTPESATGSARFLEAGFLSQWKESTEGGLMACKACYSSQLCKALDIHEDDAIGSSGGDDDDDDLAVQEARSSAS